MPKLLDVEVFWCFSGGFIYGVVSWWFIIYYSFIMFYSSFLVVVWLFVIV